MQCDLRGNRSIDLGFELRRAELGVDPDFRQLCYAVAHNSASAPIG